MKVAIFGTQFYEREYFNKYNIENKHQLVANELPNNTGKNLYALESDGTGTSINTDPNTGQPNIINQYLIIPDDANKLHENRQPSIVTLFIQKMIQLLLF